ncbi:MAG: Tat protein translocase TatC [Verrucomicrobiales bacterium]|jgi:Tat protein translocase TatC
MFFIVKMLRDKAAKYKKDHSDGEDEKPFLEHLEDLRKTLFKLIITVGTVTIAAFAFNKGLLDLIQFPLYMADIPPDARILSTLGAVEGMMLAIKVSLYAGIVISFPLIIYFIGEFVMPGLKDREKKLVLPSIAVGAGLFAIGICFSYFVVIPRALEFFYLFSKNRGWGYDLRAGYYISFAVQMVLVFGISFEMPVVVMALVKLEILSHRVMRSSRSTAIVIMVIISALITPTTDVITLSFLAGPLIVLYEICIWLAWWLEKKRAKEEERERLRSLPEAKRMPPPEIGSGDGATAVPLVNSPDQDHIDSDHIESVSPSFDNDNEFKESDAEEDGGEDNAADEPDISPDGEVSKTDADTDGSAENDHQTGHDEYGHSGDDYWNDPSHHDHQDGYHDSSHDYYSGPIEELKRELREELTQQIKAELRVELLAELRKELNVRPSKAKRISIDPRRIRRPK